MTDVLDVTPDDLLLSDKEIQPSLATAPLIAVSSASRGQKAWATRRANAEKASPQKKAQPKKVTAARAESLSSPAPRRRPVGELLGDVIEKLAVMAGAFNPPGARALAFASPALGGSLDKVVAGSYIDKRVLQPLVGGTEKWATLASAAGLPFMVMAVSMQPQLFPVLETQMRAAMVVCLEERVRVLKKRRVQEKNVTKILGELKGIDDELAQSEDPIGDLLQGFFAGFVQEEAAPTEEENVGAAV